MQVESIGASCNTFDLLFKRAYQSLKLILMSSFECSLKTGVTVYYLAHLSQSLIGELIGYSWSGVRPSSSVVNNFKYLILQNRLLDQSQILCGASFSRGNESFFVASGPHDQDGRHAHIW